MDKQYPCPSCGWSHTRRSRQRDLIAWLAIAMLLIPYRCHGCRTRFFRFRNGWARAAVYASLVIVIIVVAVTFRPRGV
jgi:hypothetical protein